MYLQYMADLQVTQANNVTSDVASDEELMLWTDEEDLLASLNLNKLGGDRAESKWSWTGFALSGVSLIAMLATIVSTAGIFRTVVSSLLSGLRSLGSSTK